MDFREVRFPDDIDYGLVGSISGWNTLIIKNRNAIESRQQLWTIPLGSWNLTKTIQSDSDIQKVLAFHLISKGRLIGFRFKDWGNYKIEGQIIGTGDGIETVFPIYKEMEDGSGDSYLKRIYKIVDNSIAPVNVYLDDVLQTGDYDIDYNEGRISFTGGAPSNGVIVKLDCEFDLPCRFDIDNLPISIDEFNSSSISNLPIVELKLNITP